MNKPDYTISWGGAWCSKRPIARPRFCVVTYRGRVYISTREVPAGVSINDREHWRKICNVYELAQEGETLEVDTYV